jgi:glycosyltransferase involved in cell wall biosynthesis
MTFSVSIIIPVYNAESFLEKAVNSCLQLEEVKEIILIEDGSLDNSLKLCKDLSLKNNIIKLLQHPNGLNNGAGPSRSLGIVNAQYDYIAFLDADDVYLANRFTKDKEIFLKNVEADGCYNSIGNFYYSEIAKRTFCKKFNISIENADNFLTAVNPKKQPSYKNCFYGLIGMIPHYGYFSLDGLTLRKESLSKINALFLKSSMHEDTDFIIRLSYYCKLYPAELERAVCLRGVHENNRISSDAANHNSRLIMYQELYKWAKLEVEDQKVIYKLSLDVKCYHFLVNVKKYSLFKGLFYTLSHKGLLYSERHFNLIVSNSSASKKIKTLTIKIKEKGVLLFFKKATKKHTIIC